MGRSGKTERTFRAARAVMVVGMHVDQGFCVRFPAEARRRAARNVGRLERSRTFLAEQGTVEPPSRPLSTTVLTEARDVLSDADDGCHLHLQDDED